MPEAMEECIFCKMSAHKIPVTMEFENDNIFAIHDIHPKAPLHVLVIPKQHVMESMNDFAHDKADLLSEMFKAAKDITAKYGADRYGYKLLFNVGQGGGQSVMHLHLHVIGKKKATDHIKLTD
jgi:histidine triad (HIT) family protein